MKKFVLLFVLNTPLLAIAQEHHVGIRVGEPFSITYKTYLDKKYSVEAMVGRAGANSAQYYRRAFENNRPYSSAIYTSHASSDAFSLNLRGAYNEDISSEFNIVEGALFAYGGVGVQLRSVRLNYVYHTSYSNTDMEFRNIDRTNVDFGPEGFVGSEYFFEELPISVFAELGLFLEIINRPGHIRLQGGLGVRYIF